MTTAIIARNYDDAREAARRLGCGQDWVYPHSQEVTRGMAFTRVVFVDGWSASAITVEEVEDINARAAEGHEVTTLSLAEPAFDQLIAPVIDHSTTEPENYTPRHAQGDRTALAGLLTGALTGAAIAIGYGILAYTSGWWPWAS